MPVELAPIIVGKVVGSKGICIMITNEKLMIKPSQGHCNTVGVTKEIKVIRMFAHSKSCTASKSQENSWSGPTGCNV